VGKRNYRGSGHRNGGGGGLNVAALVFVLLCIAGALWVYSQLMGR